MTEVIKCIIKVVKFIPKERSLKSKVDRKIELISENLFIKNAKMKILMNIDEASIVSKSIKGKHLSKKLLVNPKGKIIKK